MITLGMDICIVLGFLYICLRNVCVTATAKYSRMILIIMSLNNRVSVTVCLITRNSHIQGVYVEKNLIYKQRTLTEKMLSEIGKWIVDGSKRLSAFLWLTSVCIHNFSPHETEDIVPLLPHCPLARSHINHCLTGLSGVLLHFRNKKIHQQIINYNFLTTYNQ